MIVMALVADVFVIGVMKLVVVHIHAIIITINIIIIVRATTVVLGRIRRAVLRIALRVRRREVVVLPLAVVVIVVAVAVVASVPAVDPVLQTLVKRRVGVDTQRREPRRVPAQDILDDSGTRKRLGVAILKFVLAAARFKSHLTTKKMQHGARG